MSNTGARGEPAPAMVTGGPGPAPALVIVGPGGRGARVLRSVLVACRLSLVANLCLSSAVMAATTSKDYGRMTEQLAQAIETCKRLARQTVAYDVVFRRDPMRPLVDGRGELVSSAGMHGGFSVQGIIWSDEHPLAVIDDELFAQGDVVGPYTILQIHPDSVSVQRGEETLLIPLDRGIEALPTPVPLAESLPNAPEPAQSENAPAAGSAPQ